MASCPNFECLEFSMYKCIKYPACSGCPKLFDCSVCNNQASLVEGKSLPCDMIELPEPCRFCAKRMQQDFSAEESCPTCSYKRNNTQPPPPAL